MSHREAHAIPRLNVSTSPFDGCQGGLEQADENQVPWSEPGGARASQEVIHVLGYVCRYFFCDDLYDDCVVIIRAEFPETRNSESNRPAKLGRYMY